MNSKGMTPEYLVALIVIGVFLVSALYIWGDDIKPILMGTSQKGACSLELLLSNFADTEAIQGCKKNNVLVTPQLLQEYAARYQREYTGSKRNNFFDAPNAESTFSPQRKGANYAWALNRITADEFKDCVDKTGAGKLAEKYSLAGGMASELTCLVCSRIVITPEAYELFQNSDYDVAKDSQIVIQPYFSEWVKANPVGRDTYEQYISRTAVVNENLGDKEFQDNLKYIFTTYHPDFRKPIAIMLVNVPFSGLLHEEKDTRWIQSYSYEDITKDELFPYYGGVVNIFGDVKSCGVIIE